MDKIWLKQYTQGVPDTINPDAFTSLVHFFEKYANDFLDQPVFTNFGTEMTYREMKTHTRNFAAFLQQQLKSKKGARIAMMMPNILQYPVAIFGALKSGLIVVNVNPLYTAKEIEVQVNDAEAEAIVVLENFADHLEGALPHTQLRHVIITKMGDMLGSFKGAFFNFMLRYVKGKVPDYDLPNAIFFKQALAIGKQSAFEPVELKNTETAFLQYTGGTTGRSKAVILSHRNIISNVLQCVSWIRDVEVKNRAVMLGALPMYHIFSLTVCGTCIFPMGGSSVLITNPRDTRSMLKEIKNAKLTTAVGLNTLFQSMLVHPDINKVDFSHLRLTISGGMAMQRSVADQWQAVTGVPILEGYGLTESSPVLTLCPVSMTHFTGSIGIPVPSTDVMICDELGNELGFHQPGEVYGRGPQVMSGYWRRDEETKAVLDSEGWLHTGDIGYMDERGFVYIVDRKKDMVLVSGFNVYPNEVEAVIAEHPGVRTVAVIGIPSEKTGEALKAFIIKKDPALTAEQVIAFCRESLTGYKIPKLIEFRDQLPMSNVGKVLRRELRESEKQHVEK